MTENPSTPLTVPEAATYLHVSRATVNRLISRGELRSLKIGRSRRVTLRQLDDYVDHRTRVEARLR